MDVDADGSDADRLPGIDGSSANFKPFTSYRWKKKTAQQSTFLPPAEAKLRRYEAEFAQKGLTLERNRDLRIGIQRMKAEVDSLKRFSFLIASTDPYIVLPGIFTGTPDAGKVGDYAVVIYGNAIYPAIVGDVGPRDKVGEASLRISKEINPVSSAYSRPVSDLKVELPHFSRHRGDAFRPARPGEDPGPLRKTGAGNGRRDRAAASLGEPDPDPDADSLADPHTIPFADTLRDAERQPFA